MAGARHPRHSPEGADPAFQATPAVPIRDARASAKTPVKHRLSLAELLVDAEASEQLTRETMWLQEIPVVGIEID